MRSAMCNSISNWYLLRYLLVGRERVKYEVTELNTYILLTPTHNIIYSSTITDTATLNFRNATALHPRELTTHNSKIKHLCDENINI